MTAMLELSRLIEVDVLPHGEISGGRAWAYVLIDYGQMTDVVWQVFMRDTGESWFVRNKYIRLANCATWGTGDGRAREYPRVLPE